MSTEPEQAATERLARCKICGEFDYDCDHKEAGPIWTDKKPTEPGDYAYVRIVLDIPVIWVVQVDEHGGLCRFSNNGRTKQLEAEFPPGYWLKLPEMPK